MRPYDPLARIAVVIPVFKHSALVREALASILDQEGARQRPEIVIVDDGCPVPQTFLTLAALPETHANVHYVRQANAGLSAARNCGIRFVCERLPTCEAIYFLDADNRLSPHSLSVFEAALDASEADWFYPDIAMFGIAWRGDYSGPFRRLTETFMNLCEAGSLVRTRVFEAGIFFDEAMRDGYEDWEFWLAAIQRGFRGEHLPRLGLQYRKRAESMVAESARVHGTIVSYMERKHGWLRDLGVLTTMEHLDAPRYAIIDIEAGTVRLTSDPEHASEELSLAAYRCRLRASFALPNWHAVGAFVVVTSASALGALGARGLLRFAFWDLEQHLLEAPVAALSLCGSEDGRLRATVGHPAPDDPFHAAAIPMQIFRKVIEDTYATWIAAVPSLPRDLPLAMRRFELPDLALPPRAAANALAQLAAFCLDERKAGYPSPWSSAAGLSRGVPDVAELPLMARAKFGNAVMANRVGSRAGRVAFVLPIYEFGGVEKVAFFVARAFKRMGYRVDLIILGRSDLQPHERQAEAFEQTFFVDHAEFNRFGGPEFLGTGLPDASYPNGCDALTNLLSTYEVVIGCHAADALGSFSALRKRGVLTVNYLHLLEYTTFGRMVGHSVLGLAYEHATDLYLTCSERLSQELGMLGVPADKIVTITNACGLDLDVDRLNRLTAERDDRARTRAPLRVLYLGRLDLQKGIDRVAEIFEVLAAEPASFELAAFGSAVLDGADIPGVLAGLVKPAVHTEAELTALYAWADVVVLPSRYEGVPLTLLEAQAYGVVPVATRVGAIDEIIADGVDGLFVSEDAAVADALAMLRQLEADRNLLRRLSEAAAAAGRDRTWEASTKAALAALTRIQKARPQDYRELAWLDGELSVRDAAAK
ncbi:MAG: glycosyltransferase [Methylobacterium sp.]|uniref:glycosyltransferase n=1 Tax=Methylobacterium sp. TaxID=409 RepID=UPI0025F86F4E|nr:glycosyltransferase [Methylobacterium sp.]MBX9934793.1 glycosyltransferase [Methylobacterium sp.]